MDFNEMIKQHEQSGAEISIATYPVNAKDATSFGIMKTNEENPKPTQKLQQKKTESSGGRGKSKNENYGNESFAKNGKLNTEKKTDVTGREPKRN